MNKKMLTGMALISIYLLPWFFFAGDAVEHIPIPRKKADTPISRDEILETIKSHCKGRILSLEEKPTVDFPDCHVIRVLTIQGEYLTLHLACDKER